MLLVALSLVMLLTGVVPVQAESTGGRDRAPILEDCAAPAHLPGEFEVIYESRGALRGASEEGVIYTEDYRYVEDGPYGAEVNERYVQYLRFEDLVRASDPVERSVREEARKKELEGRPGVRAVYYVYREPKHEPGEFWVRYESREALRAASEESVVHIEDVHRDLDVPGDGKQQVVEVEEYAQYLRFERIRDERDPDRQRALEEARRKELEKRPGVESVEYVLQGPPDLKVGEFWAYYDSEEAMRAAPRENVVGTTVYEEEGAFVQHLSFEEIKNEPDPNKQQDAMLAKRGELEVRPGVWAVMTVVDSREPPVSPNERPDGCPEPDVLWQYICTAEGLEELFGGDMDTQRERCGIYATNPGTCVSLWPPPGEFEVYYTSEEAYRQAPRKNEVKTENLLEDGGVIIQYLSFEELKNIPNPKDQRAAQEAKKKELAAQPGVWRAEYAPSEPGHAPGEFEVIYESEKAMRAAPEENVIDSGGIGDDDPGMGEVDPGQGKDDGGTGDGKGEVDTGNAYVPQSKAGSGEGGGGIFWQRLLFEEIKNASLDEQRALEEAKMEELKKRPGVEDVRYVYPGEDGGEPGQPESPCGEGFMKLNYEYICGPEGLRELFGGDVDFQQLNGPVSYCPHQGGGGGCYPQCLKGIVERAKNTIGGGSNAVGGASGGASGKDGGKATEKAGGRLAFDAALEGVRSASGRSVSALEELPGIVTEGSGGKGSIPARSGEAGSGTAREVADAKPRTAKTAANDEPDEKAYLDDGGYNRDASSDQSVTTKEAASTRPDEETTDVAGSAADGGEGEAEGPVRSDVGEEGADVEKENAAAGDAVPGQKTPGDTALGGTAPGGTAPGGTAPDDGAPGGASSGNDDDGTPSFLSGPLNGIRNVDPEGKDVELGVAANTKRGAAGTSALILGLGALFAAGVFAARRILRR